MRRNPEKTRNRQRMSYAVCPLATLYLWLDKTKEQIDTDSRGDKGEEKLQWDVKEFKRLFVRVENFDPTRRAFVGSEDECGNLSTYHQNLFCAAFDVRAWPVIDFLFELPREPWALVAGENSPLKSCLQAMDTWTLDTLRSNIQPAVQVLTTLIDSVPKCVNMFSAEDGGEETVLDTILSIIFPLTQNRLGVRVFADIEEQITLLAACVIRNGGRLSHWPTRDSPCPDVVRWDCELRKSGELEDELYDLLGVAGLTGLITEYCQDFWSRLVFEANRGEWSWFGGYGDLQRNEQRGMKFLGHALAKAYGLDAPPEIPWTASEISDQEQERRARAKKARKIARAKEAAMGTFVPVLLASEGARKKIRGKGKAKTKAKSKSKAKAKEKASTKPTNPKSKSKSKSKSQNSAVTRKRKVMK